LVSVQVVLYEGVLKSGVLWFLLGYTYLNETTTGNFLKLHCSLIYSYFFTWSPLQSTNICQLSSSFVVLHSRIVPHDDRTTTWLLSLLHHPTQSDIL
jgi:hypothetical protein